MNDKSLLALHHEEQTEAARADFGAWWHPMRHDLLSEGISFWTLCRLETRAWELWLTAHNLTPQPH